MPKLQIAYVSYEYPPDIGQGGIATYIGQIATAMVQQGHYVEIFSGSLTRQCTEVYNNIITHRILCKSSDEFRSNVVKKFIARHQVIGFDLFECAEINADGAIIKEQFPELPLVVKLHTPSYLIVSLLNYYTSPFIKFRFLLGNLRRGKWRPFGKPDLSRDKDFIFTTRANLIYSPSSSLKEIISSDWKFPVQKIKIAPNPYKPSDASLSIPININESGIVKILFVGKLNIHKGVLNLAKAIPGVMKAFQHVNFIFIGSDGNSPLAGVSMRVYLEDRLKDYENVTFTGAISLEDLPGYLADADICVVPSLWENFPYVCLEAMSAGRAVIGSNRGGMNEMLADNAGILVDPTKPRQIEKALKLLILQPELRIKLGETARNKVLKEYNLSRVGKITEELYFEAIDTKHHEY